MNWHICSKCNYNCIFCFAGFQEINEFLSKKESYTILRKLNSLRINKITFTGGEPFLHPYLGDLLIEAKYLDFITMIVTNGSLLTESFLRQYYFFIDWIELSLDSCNEKTQLQLVEVLEITLRTQLR